MRRLDDLAGERVGRFRLKVAEWQPAAHAQRFQFAFELEGRHAPPGSIFSGIYHASVPARNVAGWIDGSYAGQTAPDPGVSLRDLDVEEPLFSLLRTVVPPNGWLALAYETLGVDTTLFRETRRLLSLGAPPIVTPLGLLLHRAGCGWYIRDWYIAEGGREGPRKLQGFRPANAESEARRKAETLETLRRFLDRASGEPELAAARDAAERLAEEAS